MYAEGRFLALFLCCAALFYAQGSKFTRIRYDGGSVASRVDAKDWDNILTVTPGAIVLQLKRTQELEIPAQSVTSLSYGQEAHRRLERVLALAVLIAPVAHSGFFRKTRLHFIGVQYVTPNGRNAGILLQGDPGNYRTILVALQGVTGAPVWVTEKERESVPAVVTTNVTRSAKEGISATGSSPGRNVAVGAARSTILTPSPSWSGMPAGGGYSRR
jgi:hypothetical protein